MRPRSLERRPARNPAAQHRRQIAEPLPPFDFGRIAAQSAKQVIVQKVREAERDRQYDEYKDRVGEIVIRCWSSASNTATSSSTSAAAKASSAATS
jgi:hypothetical protein